MSRRYSTGEVEDDEFESDIFKDIEKKTQDGNGTSGSENESGKYQRGRYIVLWKFCVSKYSIFFGQSCNKLFFLDLQTSKFTWHEV